MEKEHFSKEWDDAPMPYSIFFTGAGPRAARQLPCEEPRPPRLPRLRPHPPDNAAKLFALVQKTGMSNTRVIVKGGFFADGEDRPTSRRRSPSEARSLLRCLD